MPKRESRKYIGEPLATAAEDRVRVAVIVGSIRADRFGPTPAKWIANQAMCREDIDVDLIDLADHDCPVVLGGNDAKLEPPTSVRELSARVAVAEAIILVTPVYNRSYPGSLKNAIDWLYSEWQLKPVGLVSYGGITGGLQAVEHLRAVFAEFHGVVLRDTVMFQNFWERFDHDGQPVDVDAVGALADGFLDQLVWWARTLREGRARQPYPFGRDD